MEALRLWMYVSDLPPLPRPLEGSVGWSGTRERPLAMGLQVRFEIHKIEEVIKISSLEGRLRVLNYAWNASAFHEEKETAKTQSRNEIFLRLITQ